MLRGKARPESGKSVTVVTVADSDSLGYYCCGPCCCCMFVCTPQGRPREHAAVHGAEHLRGHGAVQPEAHRWVGRAAAVVPSVRVRRARLPWLVCHSHSSFNALQQGRASILRSAVGFMGVARRT